MAKINPSSPIADIHGALQRGDKVIYRVRDGVQQAYTSTRKYKSQLNRYIREQRERSLANPLSTFHFRPAVKRTPKPPTTLYGMILSELSKASKAAYAPRASKAKESLDDKKKFFHCADCQLADISFITSGLNPDIVCPIEKEHCND